MRSLLIHSAAFSPSVGGLEFMAELLAEESSARGWNVGVVTASPGPVEDRPYRVHRNPPTRELLRLLRSTHAVLFMNIGLRALAPFAAIRRPWIVSHQTHYGTPGRPVRLADRIKRVVARHATNVACSRAIAATLPPGTIVVPNAYDERVFRRREGTRNRDLLFVGRLVSDKGADILLESAALLRQRGRIVSMTIVGAGPDEGRLRDQCRAQGLDPQVAFAGQLDRSRIAGLMNDHRVMAVPSRVEPFGIVALEGIACGCVVVASDAGGLPEAVGECGLLVRRSDPGALADGIARALSDTDLRHHVDCAAPRHLAKSTRGAVAGRYLDIIQAAMDRRAGT